MSLERVAPLLVGACLALIPACSDAPAPNPGSGTGSGSSSTGTGGTTGGAATGSGSGGSSGATAGGASGVGGSGGASTGAGGSSGAGVGGTAGAGSGGNGGAGGASGGSGGTGGGGPTFHVFLLLGQSNMAGYPKAQTADKVENPRITVLGFDNCQATGRQTDVWDTAVPPLHECGVGAIGPGDWFSKTIIDSLPAEDTIGLVPCAISGEKIETFMKAGGNKYSWIIERAEAAQAMGGVIDGILFHQGESNCGDPAWPGKVATLVNDLRTDLGIPNAPFLAGELAYTGDCSNHNPLVNDLPESITNAHVISAQDLAVDPADTQWNLHFGHDAVVTFGQRYAEKMISALGW